MALLLGQDGIAKDIIDISFQDDLDIPFGVGVYIESFILNNANN